MAMGAQTGVWSNWSGKVTATPKAIVAPRDEDELRRAVRDAEGPVRVPGTGHSFTPIAATDGTLIDMSAISGVTGHDMATLTATVRAGTKIHAIGRPLWDRGLALKNQGDIDRQSIAGALSTATHGTGKDLPCLAAEIVSFRLVTADGDVLTCSPHENVEVFQAGRVGLGLFGVFSEVTLSVAKAYALTEESFVISADEVIRELGMHRDANRHFEFFWFPYSDNVAAKRLNPTATVPPPPLASEQMKARGEVMTADQRAFQAGCEIARYIPSVLPRLHKAFTSGAAGKPKTRWSHEIFPSPRNVRFNEMEYAVPADKAVACLTALTSLFRQRGIHSAFPFEFRFVRADDIWLSPFYQRDCATISVHQYYKQSEARLFSLCEGVFRDYDARPHWGKMHTAGPDRLERLYPKFAAFRALRRRLDPRGKFLTPYLAKLMGETADVA
jgi:FAD-linked oxidoreductase